MEAGDWWQLSCVPKEAHTPAWAQGAIIYQVFPDRFAKSGSCDLTGKLEPTHATPELDRRGPLAAHRPGRGAEQRLFGGNFRVLRKSCRILPPWGLRFFVPESHFQGLLQSPV